MDKNKSIDGLTVRRPKKAPSKAARTPNKSTTKTIKAAKPAVQPIKPKPISKSASKSVTPKSSKPSKSAKPIANPTKKPAANAIAPTATITPDSMEPKADAIEDFLKPVQAFDFDEVSGELKSSSHTKLTENSSDNSNQPKSKKLKKSKKPMTKKRKIITGIILSILILLIGVVTWLILWGNDIIAKITGGQGNVLDLIFPTEHYEPLKTDENGRTNILAFGTSGYNMNGDEGDGTHDGAQLTDSIMIISLDQETGDFAMLSLPRDLKASPTCTATGKINEVYWCSNMEGDNEQAGAEALMNEVSNILGLDFQYYAHINWGSLVQIVDTLGGINVTLDEDIQDYGWTGAVFQAGTEYTINGEQALGLARARHGTAAGDFSRGASQQKILIGIKDKVFEKDLSITDLMGLASTLGDNLRTNFSIDEIKTLAHLTEAYDLNNMRQISLIEPERLMTTGTINGISYVLPAGGANYYTKIQNYVAKMFSSDPRKYEDASILVLNGTDTPGLASTEQASLDEEGYPTIYVDDAPAGEYSAEYTLYDLTDSKPGTKKLLEEKYHITAEPANNLPAGIDTTCDFVIILGGKPNSEE